MDVATKRAQSKDADGVLVVQIAHSESHLKEFSDTSYRGKFEFVPTSALELGKREVPPRHMLQAIAFVIYDLNKFASAATIQNARECEKQICATSSIGVECEGQ